MNVVFDEDGRSTTSFSVRSVVSVAGIAGNVQFMLIAQKCFVEAGYVNVLLAEEVAECGYLLANGSDVDVKSVKIHRHHLVCTFIVFDRT